MMRKKGRFFWAGLLLTVRLVGAPVSPPTGPASGAAAPPGATPPTPAGAAASARARTYVEAEIAPHVPGLSAAVSIDGKMVWSENFGYADLENKVPVTSATLFRIASVSKPMTAAGLALLVERGLVDLDAPIQTYLPDFPVKKEGKITLRLLAGHLSGIRNYRGSEILLDRSFPNLRAGLKLFEDDPLVAMPGAKFGYSSFNWNVIGAAMEQVTHEEFDQFMRANVFLPLGLTRTVAERSDESAPNIARGYEFDPQGQFVRAPHVDNSYKWPSGGFLSTAEDMVRFGNAFLAPGFLKAQTLHLLFTAQATATGLSTHYGIGWFVRRNLKGDMFCYHMGDAVGSNSALLIIPATRTVVGLVCNRGHLILAQRDGRTVIDQPVPSAINWERAAKLAGIFSSAVRTDEAP